MKKVVLLICFLVGGGVVMGQAPRFEWAKGFGGKGDDHITSVATDKNGNVYTTGYFNGKVDFDPDTGVLNITSKGGADIFITKLNAKGTLVWVKSIGGSSGDGAVNISIGTSGNIYLVGSFSKTVDFDPDTGVYSLKAGSSYDYFILKLDSAGKFNWVKDLNGKLKEGIANVILDANENIYTAGTIGGNGVVGDFSFAKFDSAGTLIWERTTGGSGFSNEIRSIGVDAIGNFYISGEFSDSADFDPDTSSDYYLKAQGANDIFIAKYDILGEFLWAKQLKGIKAFPYFKLNAMVVDSLGSVYTTGTYIGAVDFDPDSSSNYFLDGLRNGEGFLSKLDANGRFVWAEALNPRPNSMTFDNFGNICLFGKFYGGVDFNPDTTKTLLIGDSNGGSPTTFILKLDNRGVFIWGKQCSSPSIEFTRNLVKVDQSDNIIIAGDFYTHQINFDSILITSKSSDVGIGDFYIAKLGTTLYGIREPTSKNSFSVYPNPASNYFTVDLRNNNEKATITITDVTGKPIYTTTTINSTEINTTNFSNGVYFVQVKTGDFVAVRKVVVER